VNTNEKLVNVEKAMKMYKQVLNLECGVEYKLTGRTFK